MRQRLPRSIMVVAVTAVLLLLLGSWITQRSLQQLSENVDTVNRTFVVLELLARTLATLQEAETGQRDFVLTGDEKFLIPYNRAVGGIAALSRALRRETADSPIQQQNLDVLEPLIATKLLLLKSKTDLVRSGRRAEAIAEVAGGGGLAVMHDTSDLVERMRRQEYALLAVRTQVADDSRERLRRTTLALTALGLVLVWALAAASRRELRIGERLRREIQAAQASIEQRVQQRTAELRAVNEELESFAYSVSHDLRSPLRAVSGFAQILAGRHRDGLNEEGRHYVDNVVEASARMGVLIDDLLQYSRVGRGAIRSQPVPLAPIVRQVCSSLAARIESTGAVIDVVEPLATPAGDATMLSRILANLLDNALTYRQSGVPPRIRIRATAQDSTVVLEVQDNGIGIPAEYKEKVFEVFQRLHSVDEYPGTGIGLAIVRKSARVMGGRVSVESTPSQGSTFFVRLPAASNGSPQ